MNGMLGHPVPVALAGDRWEGLRTLVWARLLVAALALPFGILLRPDTSLTAWRLLTLALVVVAVASAVGWLGAALRRGHGIQVGLNLTFDVLLVTGLSTLTGGQHSPFALFYVLVVITGGLQAGLAGGLITALASGTAFLALQPDSGGLTTPLLGAALPKPNMFGALLIVLGVLASALRQRVRRAREHLERAARELERVRFDNDVILRHLTSGVITLDGTGALAYLNPAAEAVLGIRLEDARGRNVQEALPERLRPLREVLLGVLERHTVQTRGEVQLQSVGGPMLPIGLSTNMLRHDGEITGVVAVFTDLTEVREMEARARRNQTLAEVGALAAGIAHELRNGLSPINGSVECLQRELKLEGENAQLMSLIQAECSRLNRFVTDLLTYSKERPLVRETIDLNETLADLCEHLARDPRRGAGVSVRFEPGEGSAEVPADREQLRQVWLNLAGNAFEAMETSGALIVRWRAAGAQQVTVEFIDDGPGIKAEDMAHVGQPFFTTKKGGTGLGLAIAQRIVERHSGVLSLRPAAERGTAVQVTLPGAVAAVVAAA